MERVEGGRVTFPDGNGGARALGLRIEGRIDARGKGFYVLAGVRAEGNRVDDHFRPVGTAHASDEERMVVDAAGRRGGQRQVEQERELEAIHGGRIHGQVVHRVMDRVALQRTEIGGDGLEFEHRGAGSEAVAHISGQRFTFGVVENQVGQFRRFRGAERQFQGNGGHALNSTAARRSAGSSADPSSRPVRRVCAAPCLWNR